MNTYKDKILTYLLTPISWIYGGAVRIRNKLYDSGILKEVEHDVPVVSVGNLTIGGTGKTPHVEYLVDHLKSNYKIAVLSRGYKRKTKGFVLATSTSTPEQIGDESYQIYKKFGQDIVVAVAEDRNLGIKELRRLFPDVDLVILDDAFQHRSVKPTVSILLLDKNRPIEDDRLLPLGRLREPVHGKDRADIVVVTKCPSYMNPLEYGLEEKKLDLLSFQKAYFSTVRYEEIKPVFPEMARYSASLSALTEDDKVLLVTGIAFPRTFVRYFKDYPFNVSVMRFPDHHDFCRKDIEEISSRYEAMGGRKKIIVTTEKDAVRIQNNPYFPHELKPYIFYLPIKIHLHYDQEKVDLIEQIEIYLRQRKTKTN